MTIQRFVLFMTVCATVVGAPMVAQQKKAAQTSVKGPADQWPNYQTNSNYSPLTQITPQNVSRLTQAWTFKYGAGGAEEYPFLGLDNRFEVQPLLIGGVMYISTPSSPLDPNLKSTVTALEPETGKILWQYTSPRNIHGRGIAYWPGTSTIPARLFFATDKGYLMAIGLKTGEPVASWGNGGVVDAYKDVVSAVVGESRRDTYAVPNPLTVYKNLIIGGARPGEVAPPQPRGDIRAWDAITGKVVWDFHVIPQPGEPNHEEWAGDSWKDRSGCNVWSNLTADPSTGLVFGATGDANRAVPGKNLYCNSILALDGDTGKLKWFFQIVHHDAADYDMPTPPILINVLRNGQTIPAVLQTGKLHFAYIFNRMTGEPIYGAEERPVRRALGENDPNWPTQPFPLKPPPTGRLTMTRNDVNKMTPEIEKFCTDFWDQNHMLASKAFDRAGENDAMVTFGAPVGGWGPLSYNPQLGYVFLNVTNAGNYHAAGSPIARAFGEGNDPANADAPAATRGQGQGRGQRNAANGATGAPPERGAGGGGGRGGGGFAYRLPSGNSVSCMAPPYGAMVAVNVNTGDIAWSVPLGINDELKELGEIGLKSGIRNIGGSIATASGLVFIGATVDQKFRAFDAKTGKELWVTNLPANGNATPITYMGKDGAQYVAIPAGGGGPAARGQAVSDALVAFRLPK